MTRVLSECDRELLDRAARWPDYRSWRELSAPVLQRISRHHGIDFATALLYDRIVRSPEHGPFIQRMETPTPLPLPRIRIVLVPGACYREYPQTGADGRRLRDGLKQRGACLDVVPVESFGRLSQNARMLLDWFRARADEPTLLVTLSKGVADFRTALADPDGPTVFRNVVAWINLSGTPFGSVLPGWFLGRPLYRMVVQFLCWRHGYLLTAVAEMERKPGGPLDGDFTVPAPMQVIHVVGFPLFRHLRTRRARLGYRRVAELGPNDAGGNLLGDLHRLPGLIYPLWGVDHYMHPEWDIQPLVDRLLTFACEETAHNPVAARDARTWPVPDERAIPEEVA